MSSETNGEVEKEGNVLVIKRIHVVYRLKTGEENRETAVRVHGFHAGYCPVAQSIKDCIDITTELNFIEP